MIKGIVGLKKESSTLSSIVDYLKNNATTKVNTDNDEETFDVDDITNNNYNTVLSSNNGVNSEIDEYIAIQDNTLELISNIKNDINEIYFNATGNNILKTTFDEYEKDYKNEVTKAENDIYKYYSDDIISGNADVELLNSISKDEVKSLSREEFLERIYELYPKEKEKIDVAKQNVEIKYQKIVDEFNKNDYNFSSFLEFMNYYNNLEMQELQVKYMKNEAIKLQKIQPYMEMMETEDFKNYIIIDHKMDEEKIQNSWNGDYYSYESYSKQYGDCDPIDFVRTIQRKDTLNNRGNAWSEVNNVDIDAINALIDASQSNPDLLKMYHYLYETQGLESANKFLVDAREEINKTIAIQNVQNFQKALNDGKDFDDACQRTLQISSKGLEDGIRNFSNGFSYLICDNDCRSVSDYETMYISMLLQNNEVKKQNGLIDENGNSNSAIDFSVDYSGKLNISDDIYAISSSIGGLLPNTVISMINPALGTIAMSLSGTGNKYHQKIIEGSDKGTAIIYSIISGTSNAVLQRIIGTLPFISNDQIETFSQLFMAMPKEAMSSGMREMLDIMLESSMYGKTISFEEATSRMGKSIMYGMITSFVMNLPGVTIHSTEELIKMLKDKQIRKQLIEMYKSNGIEVTDEQLKNLSEEELDEYIFEQIIKRDKEQNEQLKYEHKMALLHNSEKKYDFDVKDLDVYDIDYKFDDNDGVFKLNDYIKHINEEKEMIDSERFENNRDIIIGKIYSIFSKEYSSREEIIEAINNEEIDLKKLDDTTKRLIFGSSEYTSEESQIIREVFQQKLISSKENGEKIILTQEDVQLLSKLNGNSSPQSIEDLLWVRKTDGLGEDGMILTPSDAGAKQNIRVVYKDKEIIDKINYNRQTIHGMLNAEAENADFNHLLDTYPYIILVPLKDLPEKQIVSYRQGDTFLKDSFKLPESGVIICPKYEMEYVQKIYPDVTIIGYEGDNPIGLGDTVVNLLGYKVEKRNADESWTDESDKTVINNYYFYNNYGYSQHKDSPLKSQDDFKNDCDEIKYIFSFIKNSIPPEEREIDNITQNLKIGNKNHEHDICSKFTPDIDSFGEYSKTLHEVGIDISTEEMIIIYKKDTSNFGKNLTIRILEKMNSNTVN